MVFNFSDEKEISDDFQDFINLKGDQLKSNTPQFREIHMYNSFLFSLYVVLSLSLPT